MKRNIFFASWNILILGCLAACHSYKKDVAKVVPEQVNMHIGYDDSTLTNKVLRRYDAI